MEHNPVLTACEYGIDLTPDKAEKLHAFAEMVHAENMKHNVTGHKTLEDIFRVLVLGSIAPLKDLKVPRGTRICDIGTGAGVPGIPMALHREDLAFILVDSSEKKVKFIDTVRSALCISNIEGICARVEEIGRLPLYREGFDMVISRAMGPLFVVIETGTPLVRLGGSLYVYSSQKVEEISGQVMEHARLMGLVPATVEQLSINGIESGLLFIKKSGTDDHYPRRYSVIKRDSERFI